ncbi:MAG: hypothetical protein GKS06_10860 [Acidobacteria bacterium]|nr:hypothetical protein [Acidobacteriota bacterium]
MNLGGLLTLLACGLALIASVAGPALPQTPTIEIVAPTEDANVAGPDLRVQVTAEGVELGSRGRNGAHLLLSLDEMPAMKSYGERFTFRGVADGEHTLTVELRRPDGAAFEPAITAEVSFTTQTSRVPR